MLFFAMTLPAFGCGVSLERGGPESDGEGGAALVASSAQIGSTSVGMSGGDGGMGQGGNGGRAGSGGQGGSGAEDGTGGDGTSVASSSSGSPCGGLNEACCAGDTCNDPRHACDDGTGTCRGCVTSLASGKSAGGACILKKDGESLCWGYNDDGQLDCIENINAYLPRTIDGFRAGEVQDLGDHVCGIGQGDTVICWGDNSDGQCGQADVSTVCPVNVVALPDGASDVEVTSLGSSIALLESGEVYGWGDNYYGSMGPIAIGEILPPTQLPYFGDDNRAIAAGTYVTCALKVEGTVHCAGFNQDFGLGTEDPIDPEGGEGFPDVEDVDQLVAGRGAFCALTNGQVKCWGSNFYSELGRDLPGQSAEPLLVELENDARAVQIGGGGSHFCAVLDNGRVYCWGSNGHGESGGRGEAGKAGECIAGDFVPPIQIFLDEAREVPLLARHVAPGSQTTCAIDLDDDVWCWGSNQFYQSGVENGFQDVCLPQQVAFTCD